MKKIAVVFLLLTITLHVFSQQLEGTYKEAGDRLKFENGKLSFDIDEIGSMMNNKIGSGAYEQIGDFILVETEEYGGERSAVELLPRARKDTITLMVTDHQNYPIQGVLIESVNASGKTLLSGITGADGRILFLHQPKIKTFRTFNMGYDPLSFDYHSAKDFHVKLTKNIIVENSIAVFRVKQIDDETIAVLLLSTDFNPGKDKEKSLEKLDKKARKSNSIDKRLKKEYVPYLR